MYIHPFFQTEVFLFEFSFCIGLLLFIGLFIREFIRSLFPVQGVCADFSATTTHSLCSSEKKIICYFAASLLTRHSLMKDQIAMDSEINEIWTLKMCLSKSRHNQWLNMTKGNCSYKLTFQYH